MTLWRSLRLRGRDALPFGLAVVMLAGCSPAANVSSTAAPSPSASAKRDTAKSTVRVHVGAVRLEKPQAALSIHPAAPAATRQPAPAKPAAARPQAGAPSASPYAFASPHAPPQIIAINLSSVELTSGETVSGTIETSSNVASLEARISGWSMSVPRTRIGHFEASGQLPDIPFFMKGSYTLELIARNADGEQSERDVPITVR